MADRSRSELSETQQKLSARPSVHELCAQTFIQQPIDLPGVVAVPLAALGFAAEASYTAQYVVEVTKGTVDQPAYQKLVEEGGKARSVVALMCPLEDADSPDGAARQVDGRLETARQILSWATGNEVEPFARIFALGDETYFQILPPQSGRRFRLGFGNTGSDFSRMLTRIWELQQDHEQFAFALSLLHDANREGNPLFKIAKLFNCLEALAHKLKSKGRGSRAAIRLMLDVLRGAMTEIEMDGTKHRFDVIEFAGLIRDRVFHGKPHEEKDSKGVPGSTYELLAHAPDRVVSSLLVHCELEIARWANDASLARFVDEGRACPLPPDHKAFLMQLK